jgi:tetratricopeptide (TPR) repeat protein
MAIGVRVGGLLLIAYLFLFSGIYFLFTEKLRNIFSNENIRRLGRLLMYLVLISFIGYVLGIITWPYALQSPISNPLNAMDVMTNYATSIRQLFEGEIIWSNRVPWYYVPKYIMITVPLLILSGLLLFFLLIPRMERKLNYLWLFIIAFTFLFPVIYIIDKESNVYGGWRHSMFVFPSIVVAASLGFETLYRLIRIKYMRYVLTAAIIVLGFLPLRHIIANHPHQYIYYNEMVGGTSGALGTYEMDYYYHSMKAGTEWLIENRIEDSDAGPDNKIMVVANFDILYYFRNYNDRVSSRYVRYYERGNHDWDYAIIANSYINPYQLKNKLFPPPNTIHTIMVDKSPVCAIIERKSRLDHEGYTLLNQRNHAEAIPVLEQAVEEEPWNEAALLSLSKAYLDTRQLERAWETLSQCLKHYPDYDRALNLLGAVYMNQNKVPEALSVFTRIIQINERFVSAYHNIGLIYAQQNNLDMALKYFNDAIKVNGKFKPAYQMIGQILQSQGRTEEARQYFKVANSL